MDPVRNHSSANQKQSYLDDHQNSSQAKPKARKPSSGQGSSATMCCPPKKGPLRSEAPRPAPRGNDGLDAGYTGKDGSTQVSRDAVSKLVADSGKKSKRAQTKKQTAKPADKEESLCKKRKATNKALCNILGAVAGWRARSSAPPGFGSQVAKTCESTANWLEENAPGGACRK